MSDVKEVKITMSDADMKAFSRSTTRRRRTKKSLDEDPMSGGFAGPIIEKSSPAELASLPAPISPPAVIIPVQAPVQTVSQVATAQVPAPVLSTTAVVGGATVKIPAKKIFGSGAPIMPISGATNPRIIPTKKRISSAPAAHTLKKPRLIVPISTTAISPPKIDTDISKVGGVQTPLQPIHSQKSNKKRRFTERRISIEVKSAKATRKHRKALKNKINSMTIADIKKFLIRKGVLKPKEDGKAPPEDMMRSMLKDYLLLHAAV